jgi:G3E family GTPase
MPVEEIVGGCFCCRFTSLVEAAESLVRETAPDVLIAEPVGSCTDLVATVTLPLEQIYGDRFTVAPMSVVVDPLRAERVLGLATAKLSEHVGYIYRKQLEEAEIIVINKCDLVDAPRLDPLRAALVAVNPQAIILECSARDGIGLDVWFERLLAEDLEHRVLGFDTSAAVQAARLAAVVVRYGQANVFVAEGVAAQLSELWPLVHAQRVAYHKSGDAVRGASANAADARLITASAQVAAHKAVGRQAGVVALDEEGDDPWRLRLISFERLQPCKPFDLAMPWFSSMLVQIGQVEKIRPDLWGASSDRSSGAHSNSSVGEAGDAD